MRRRTAYSRAAAPWSRRRSLLAGTAPTALHPARPRPRAPVASRRRVSDLRRPPRRARRPSARLARRTNRERDRRDAESRPSRGAGLVRAHVQPRPGARACERARALGDARLHTGRVPGPGGARGDRRGAGDRPAARVRLRGAAPGRTARRRPVAHRTAAQRRRGRGGLPRSLWPRATGSRSTACGSSSRTCSAARRSCACSPAPTTASPTRTPSSRTGTRCSGRRRRFPRPRARPAPPRPGRARRSSCWRAIRSTSAAPRTGSRR